MKNLQLYRHTCQYFSNLGNIDYFCIDTIVNCVYVQIGSSLYRLPNDSENACKELDLKEYYNRESSPRVVGINYNGVLNAVCLAVEDGDVLLLDCDSKEVQCVGCVENGLKAIEWSPDQEIVILITGLDTIIVMTGNFDPVTEVNFHQESFGAKQFITVGWGKKETQFHGSEGKAAAHKITEVQPQAIQSDDKQPRISWRGDGALFAVSMVEPESNIRRIRIFNREGILEYTSETISGLEITLSWRPSGNLIASSQTLPNKYQVIFFEKNGLRHGEFTLPFTPGEGQVCQLAWNMESNVLAVWYEDSNATYLQLWTVNNYHWYMKQNIVLPVGQQLQGIQWDTEAGLRLHVISSGLRYSCLEWIWTTNNSCIHAVNNRAQVAVIDGCHILLSSFLSSVIPPPMYGEKLDLPMPVNQVIFGPASNSNGLCAVLSDGSVGVFSRKEKYTLVAVGTVIWACKKPNVQTVPELHHWLWLTETELICACTVGRVSYLILIDMNDSGCLTARSAVNVGDIILTLVATPDASGAVLQVQNKKLLLYKPKENVLLNFEDGLPDFYVQMEMYSVGKCDVVLGLSKRNRLYVKSSEVANNVTSLFLLPEFLLLTTSHHKLHCVRRVSTDLPELHYGRRVERGTRLVVAVGTRVLLQMPRGNLECITPRPLVLHEAAKKLDAGQYCEVFQLFRAQRINLNLLVDHNPRRFIADVAKFVQDVNNPSWLALFLLELSEEDVTVTMYNESYNQPREKHSFEPSKVVSVCDLARTAMLASRDASSYILPIIASHIQHQTEEGLSAALLEVKKVDSGKEARDEALNYLLYMVDVNKLYNVALGLYDFDLVLMVAAKSNKDPKEYIAFINKLRKLEPNYQHYTIDKHLKRFSSALKHIALCPDHFDECLELIKSYILYFQALQLFPNGSDQYQKVAAVYAEYLMQQRAYAEAAIMYKRSNQLTQALEAYQMAGDWREALLVMTQLDLSKSLVVERCRKFVSTLVGQRQYRDAAELLSRYIEDDEGSVDVLTKAHLWEEGFRVAIQANKLNLIESYIKPGISDHLQTLQQLLAANKQRFTTEKTRLAVVRATKLLQQKDNVADPREESDLYSDTSSIGSSSHTGSKNSTYTSRSSKNKRKLERKLFSLKEGSPFEDLALIRSLHQLFTNCLNLKDEVRSLCYALLRFERDIDAANLQQQYSDLLEFLDKSKGEIWQPEKVNSAAAVTGNYGPEATSNSITAGLQTCDCQKQGMALLEPHLREAPKSLNTSSWKFHMLNPVRA